MTSNPDSFSGYVLAVRGVVFIKISDDFGNGFAVYFNDFCTYGDFFVFVIDPPLAINPDDWKGEVSLGFLPKICIVFFRKGGALCKLPSKSVS